MNKIQVCKRCVMDTTDPEIKFDSNEVCSYCHRFDDFLVPPCKREGMDELLDIVEKIKKDQKNKKYDCVIGLSEDIDSAYLFYLAVVKLKLRVLSAHIDSGRNSIDVIYNIEKLSPLIYIQLLSIEKR